MRKKISSFMLFLALFFATISIGSLDVQAKDDTDVPAIECNEGVSEFAKGALKARNIIPEEALINAKTMLYSNTGAPAYSNYSVTAGQWKIIPVKASSTGLMYLETNVYSGSQSYSALIALCSDYYFEGNSIYYTYYDRQYLYGGQTKQGTSALPVKSGETYYIIMNVSGYSDAPFEIGVRARVFTTTERKLSAGTSKWTLASGMNRSAEYGKATKFKITPSKSGVIAVSLKEYGYSSSSATIQLYNKSGKAVSNAVNYYSSNGSAYFGVKKGNTYYIKVTSAYGSYDNNYKYGIKYSLTARTERSLGSKSNARTLKRKADFTNTLFLADGKTNTDWYKFKVTSKRKTCVKIDTKGISSGDIYVYFYRGGKQVGTKQTIRSYSNGNEWELTYGTTYGKANSGTYYVKVVKGKNASGNYKIKYKY